MAGFGKVFRRRIGKVGPPAATDRQATLLGRFRSSAASDESLRNTAAGSAGAGGLHASQTQAKSLQFAGLATNLRIWRAVIRRGIPDDSATGQPRISRATKKFIQL